MEPHAGTDLRAWADLWGKVTGSELRWAEGRATSERFNDGRTVALFGTCAAQAISSINATYQKTTHDTIQLDMAFTK